MWLALVQCILKNAKEKKTNLILQNGAFGIDLVEKKAQILSTKL